MKHYVTTLKEIEDEISTAMSYGMTCVDISKSFSPYGSGQISWDEYCFIRAILCRKGFNVTLEEHYDTQTFSIPGGRVGYVPTVGTQTLRISW